MRKLLLATLALLGLGVATAQAAPSLQITVQDGLFSQTDTGPVPSLVSVANTPNFNVTINVGLSFAGPGLDLGSSIISTSATGGTLVVTLSENNLSSLSSSWLTQFSGNFSTPPGTTVQLRTYLNSNNILGSTAGTLLSTLNSNSSPFALANVGAGSSGGLFSLTEVLTITTTGTGALSLDSSLVAVPEPVSLALLGAGLIGLGVVRRRSRARA